MTGEQTGLTAEVTAVADAVLRRNRRTGYFPRLDAHYRFTCPSPTSYPFQWCWDSCFHAIALSHLDTYWARAEISSLLLGADDSGFLPHMLLWPAPGSPLTADSFRIARWDDWRTATIAPPVLARAVHTVFARTNDHEWLAAVLPAVVRFFDWLAAVRADSSGLLLIGRPDESGLDSSPKYDAALGLAADSPTIKAEWHAAMHALLADDAGRPVRQDPGVFRHGRFVWVDVLLNAIYADGLACLAELTGSAGARFGARAAAVLRALLTRCWDERRGVFWDLDTRTGRPATVLTASSLFPLVLADLPEPVTRRLVAHLVDEDEFWLPHPVPSVAATEPSFDPTFATGAIFRGSSWINLNWYLHLGLRAHGRHDIAAELAARTVDLVSRSGLRECYDPYDGTGQGAHDFGWSTLVVDLLGATGGS
ncbi:glycosyl hydrolase family 63 [Lentzea atacamensis]|uniref:Glycosyl hydrolase family 63 n=1 Tax=Lentzea atacamensis TaxID=531938 RepID=A0A316HJ57_9PSEU|nr:hypothetical protein [Lentzea atacamensis]PWK80698.1 glycosyl hydrolase family 63 [Lentzea atacamensis]